MPPLSRRVAGGRGYHKGPSLLPQFSIGLTFENLYNAAIEPQFDFLLTFVFVYRAAIEPSGGGG